MISKRKLLLSLSIMLMATVMNAKEITFDFSKPDSDNQFYGVPVSDVDPLYGKVFTSGDCTISFIERDGGVSMKIGKNSITGIYFLLLKEYDCFKISTSKRISMVSFELANGSFVLTADKGTIEATECKWTGDAEEVIFTSSASSYISKIHVTLTAEDDYTEINTVSELKAVADNQHVLFNSESVCIAQSTDAMKVSASCGDDILYFLSETTPLATTEKGMVISSGVLGSKTTVDGVPAITVLGGYESKSVYAATEIGLASVSNDYIGKMVAINNVAVINEDDMLKLSDATNKLAINNIFLGTINTTNSSKRADVVGVIAKDNSGYVIHPVSVVEKLYSASESMTMPATMPAADVTVSNGAIIISGEWNHSEVYTIDGRLVASNKSQIACGSGIYLVVVDGVSIAKVTLR